MTKNNAKRFLDLKVYPNKSITLLSLITLFLLFFIATSLASLYFIFLGAWPVAFFLVLDFFLLFYAFKKYRKTSRIYDRIILKDKLFVINVNNKGVKNKKVIEPTWLRLKIYSNRKKQYLSIISRGKSVNVGKFLSLKELSDLAKVIKQALIKRESHLTYDL